MEDGKKSVGDTGSISFSSIFIRKWEEWLRNIQAKCLKMSIDQTSKTSENWSLSSFSETWVAELEQNFRRPRKTEREAKWDRDVTGQNLKFQRKSVICKIVLGASEGKPDGHREKQVSSGFLGNGRIWIIQPFLIPANRVSEVTVSTGLNERRALMSWEWLNKGNETGRYSWLMT